MSSTFVILGLGGNLGNVLQTFARAIELLRGEKVLSEIHASELFESEALLLPGSPTTWNVPFLNIAIAGTTTASPRDLLRAIKGIEKELGRKDRERWAPREIDIDILTYGTSRISESDLTIPHMGLIERPFALWPLAALAPDFELTAPDLAAPCQAREAAKRWGLCRAEIPCKTWRAPRLLQTTWRQSADKFGIRIAPGPICGTEVVGILNVTPDSFSDGGQHFSADTAVAQTRRQFQQGATVIDIGAESTRPGAAGISADEEWLRLAPVLEQLRNAFSSESLKPSISIDTRHPQTATRALQSGASWINDVTGFTNPEMVKAVRDSSCEIVVMHSLGIPPSRERTLSTARSAIDQILEWSSERIAALSKQGISPGRIIIDPGLGFGKTAQQSFELLAQAKRIKETGARVLIGHSRKSFLSLFTDKPFADRDPESALLSAFLASQGVEYVRVHDVEKTLLAMNLAQGR